MTPQDLKSLIDAATTEVETAMRVGGFIAWNHQAPLQEAAVNILPAFLRLWEAAEKMEPMLSAADEDELGIEHLMNEIRSTLDVLRETKVTP